MKVVLVSAHTHPIVLGLRYISSYLKAAGHDVELLFMCPHRSAGPAGLTAPVLDAFVERCRRADLVGMSLMTGNYHRACMLTDALRRARIKAPILWGGTHPTVAPAESLRTADIICVGEGEESVLQIATRLEAGLDPTAIEGLGFRAGSSFGNVRPLLNPARSLESDLDKYPFPDYDLSTQWLAGKDDLVPATPRNFRSALHRLRILTTRGCPNLCSYCNNTTVARLYAGKGPWVRSRSVDNIMAELVQTCRAFPTIQEINIVDDLFFVREEVEMRDFAAKYLAQVNLPLELDAHPNTVTDGKVAALSGLPIRLLSMGIQSGSADTLTRIYNRHTPPDTIAQAMTTFQKYRIPTEYHYIVGNPYEPAANIIETMRFVARHHRRAAVPRVFPLIFYPGSPMYDRAVADGLVGPHHAIAYGDRRNYMAGCSYLSICLRAVLSLRNIGMPTEAILALIAAVTSRPALWCLDRRWFARAASLADRILRKAYLLLIHQPLIKPLHYLCGKHRHKDRCPEDEVTLPRNNLAAEERAQPGSTVVFGDRSTGGLAPLCTPPAMTCPIGCNENSEEKSGGPEPKWVHGTLHIDCDQETIQ